MNRKKILVLNTKYRQFGGEDSNIIDEIETLNKHFEIKYLEFNNKNLNFFDILGFFTLSNKKSNAILRETIKSFNPDIAYVNNTWFKANLGIFDVLKELNIQTVVKIHNFRYECTRYFLIKNHLGNNKFCRKCGIYRKRFNIFNKYFKESFLKSLAILNYGKKYHKILSRYPLTIFVLNNFHKQELINSGVSPYKIEILYNPIFDNKKVQDASLKSSTDVVYAGRISNEKGVEELLKSWIKAVNNNLTLNIIGEGELLHNLKNKFSSENIIFHGFIDQDKVIKILENARAVITATKIFEGQPRLLCEASSLGIPSIFPRSGGLGEYFPDSYSLSFEQYNYDDLTEKIKLLNNDKTVLDNGLIAFEYINKLINPDDYKKIINGLIRK